MALAPVAIIVPRPTVRFTTGQTMLMADSASVLTKRATKIVSAKVYNPIESIMMIVGKANRSKADAVQFRSNGFSAIF